VLPDKGQALFCDPEIPRQPHAEENSGREHASVRRTLKFPREFGAEDAPELWERLEDDQFTWDKLGKLDSQGMQFAMYILFAVCNCTDLHFVALDPLEGDMVVMPHGVLVGCEILEELVEFLFGGVDLDRVF